MKYLAVVIAALLSPVLTDVLTFVWLTATTPRFDVSGSFWLLVAVPVVAVVLLLQVLVLWKVYRPDPWRTGAVCLTLFCIAQALYLGNFYYPPADIARYLLIIVVLGVFIIGLFQRLAWRPA